ncbi:hypothetical protein [Mycolicibacterium neoaurum]
MSRLLPTPAGPDTTMPRSSGDVTAWRIVWISAARPTSGHFNRTRKA